jgi:hypothetical protein
VPFRQGDKGGNTEVQHLDINLLINDGESLAMKNGIKRLATLAAGVLALHAQLAKAADWSDTHIGYRYGTTFGGPFEGNKPSTPVRSTTP